ncbi:hypothetical protein JW835_02185 [bacterium]|nr:hypothetical protein [bacterium]
MKKSMIFLLTFACLFTGLSHAKTPNFYVTLGIGKPMAPETMKIRYLSGAHVGMMAGFPVTTKIELVTDLSFQMAIFDTRGFRGTLQGEEKEDYVISGNNASFFTTMLKVKTMLSEDNKSRHRAYLFAGPGLFLSKTGSIQWIYQDEDDQIPEKTKTGPGATLGLGFELSMESTVFVIELGALMGFTENKTTVILPLRVGLALKP